MFLVRFHQVSGTDQAETVSFPTRRKRSFRTPGSRSRPPGSLAAWRRPSHCLLHRGGKGSGFHCPHAGRLAHAGPDAAPAGCGTGPCRWPISPDSPCSCERRTQHAEWASKHAQPEAPSCAYIDRKANRIAFALFAGSHLRRRSPSQPSSRLRPTFRRTKPRKHRERVRQSLAGARRFAQVRGKGIVLGGRALARFHCQSRSAGCCSARAGIHRNVLAGPGGQEAGRPQAGGSLVKA